MVWLKDHAHRQKMAAGSQQENSSENSSCVFCKIVRGETDTELLYEDKEFVCFRDIRPDAEHHYQVIPKTHLPSVKYLNSEHVPVIEKLEQIGNTVLQERFPDCDSSDSRMGFHWPPFSSISHLHLHVLAPVSRMGFIKKNLLFRKDSIAFVSVEWTLNNLKGKK